MEGFFDAGALAFEFGDIRPGDKSLPTCSCKDDHPDFRISVELIKNPGRVFPHFQRHRISPLGIVENQPSYTPIFRGKNFLIGLIQSDSSFVCFYKRPLICWLSTSRKFLGLQNSSSDRIPKAKRRGFTENAAWDQERP